MKLLTRIAVEWATRCFGMEHVQNYPLRSLRLAEEAIELTQAFGVPKAKMHELIELVYARPPGEPTQKLGGVALTLTVLCGLMARDPDDFFGIELRRVLSKPAEHFAKRNQEKPDV